MSSAAGDLADYLAANGLGSRDEPTVDIIDGVMPDTPDAVSVLRDTTGLQNAVVMGQREPVFEYPGVQLAFRALTHAAAHDRAWAAWYLLSKFDGGTINGRRYHELRVLQPPTLLQRDQSQNTPDGRPIFVFNVMMTRDFSG